MAGLVLCHSEGSFFPAVLTPFVAVIAWIFVDHLRWIRLPTWIANVFGLAALVMSMYEFSLGTVEGKLLSGAHMLVYLTCIVLLMQKGHRQYWWLMALTLLQMAVAAVLKTGVFFGGSMLLMMALMLWTLSVFSLYRVMDQHVSRNSKREELRKRPRQDSTPVTRSLQKNGRDSLIRVRDGLQRDRAETWVGWRFRGMVSGSFVVSLVLAAFVFAAFPRIWVPGAAAFAADAASEGGVGARSGFNDKVTLGRVGRIMLSQQRVLLFSVTSLKTRKQVSAEEFAAAIDMDEVRFRGNTLGHYHSGSWDAAVRGRESVISESAPDPLPGHGSPDPEFRVEITQDAPVGTYAFAPYPVSSISAVGSTRIHMRPITGTMIWGGNSVSDQPRTFTVECPRIDPTSESKATFQYWTIPDQAPAHIADEMKRQARRVARDYYVPGNISSELQRLYEFTNQLCRKEWQPDLRKRPSPDSPAVPECREWIYVFHNADSTRSVDRSCGRFSIQYEIGALRILRIGLRIDAAVGAGSGAAGQWILWQRCQCHDRKE